MCEDLKPPILVPTDHWELKDYVSGTAQTAPVTPITVWYCLPLMPHITVRAHGEDLLTPILVLTDRRIGIKACGRGFAQALPGIPPDAAGCRLRAVPHFRIFFQSADEDFEPPILVLTDHYAGTTRGRFAQAMPAIPSAAARRRLRGVPDSIAIIGEDL